MHLIFFLNIEINEWIFNTYLYLKKKLFKRCLELGVLLWYQLELQQPLDQHC